MKTILIRTKMTSGTYLAKVLSDPKCSAASCTMGERAAINVLLAKNFGTDARNVQPISREDAQGMVPARYLSGGNLPAEYGAYYWTAEVPEA